jgi:tRNA pseudouridine55 synthase
MQPYNGLLLINKPEGYSSFRVVSIVRGILRKASGQKNIKVGHSGTLDPAATGLLVLAIGKYTKKMPTLMKQPKEYLVEMALGSVSSTGDKEGEVTAVSNKIPNTPDIKSALNKFTGSQMQVPPKFSAIKINGQRAYNLARKGQDFTPDARPIEIYNNTFVSYEYPVAVFESRVSSGTYIRTLVEDLGNYFGTGAYMSNLRRTKVGDYSLEQALSMEDINLEKIEKNIFTIE